MSPKTSEQPGLTWLEDFVGHWYARQHGAIRAVVFLFFAILLGFIIYKNTAGTFAIYGVVMNKGPSGQQFVQNKEIRSGDKYFATNSRGMVYVVISPAEYYGLFASGELEVDLVDVAANSNVEMKATFRRFS